MFYFFYASDKLTETHMITWILDVFKTLNHKWRIFSSNMCMTLKSLQMELIRTSTNMNLKLLEFDAEFENLCPKTERYFKLMMQ